MTAAARNGASFDEVNDWESCGVLVPPKRNIGKTSALIPAAGTLIPTLFRLGWVGCKVAYSLT